MNGQTTRRRGGCRDPGDRGDEPQGRRLRLCGLATFSMFLAFWVVYTLVLAVPAVRVAGELHCARDPGAYCGPGVFYGLLLTPGVGFLAATVSTKWVWDRRRPPAVQRDEWARQGPQPRTGG